METRGWVLLVALGLVGSVMGEMNFVVRDCASNRETELLMFPKATISPHPVAIPGDLHVTGALRLNRDVNGTLKLDLSIERYVGFFWLTVPCISDVGSCTYPDVCAMLTQSFGAGTAGCPVQLTDNSVPCTCPVSAGTYSLNDAVFSIPELTGIYSWLAEGDYKITAKLIDTSGQEVACQHAEGTIVDGHPACSGFLCSIFG